MPLADAPPAPRTILMAPFRDADMMLMKRLSAMPTMPLSLRRYDSAAKTLFFALQITAQ